MKRLLHTSLCFTHRERSSNSTAYRPQVPFLDELYLLLRQITFFPPAQTSATPAIESWLPHIRGSATRSRECCEGSGCASPVSSSCSVLLCSGIPPADDVEQNPDSGSVVTVTLRVAGWLAERRPLLLRNNYASCKRSQHESPARRAAEEEDGHLSSYTVPLLESSTVSVPQFVTVSVDEGKEEPRTRNDGDALTQAAVVEALLEDPNYRSR